MTPEEAAAMIVKKPPMPFDTPSRLLALYDKVCDGDVQPYWDMSRRATDDEVAELSHLLHLRRLAE